MSFNFQKKISSGYIVWFSGLNKKVQLLYIVYSVKHVELTVHWKLLFIASSFVLWLLLFHTAELTRTSYRYNRNKWRGNAYKSRLRAITVCEFLGYFVLQEKRNISNTIKICEDAKNLANYTILPRKPAKTEAVGLNIAGSWLVKYLVKLGSDCFGTISAVCVVSLHVWNIITRHFNTAHNKHEQAKTMAPSKTLQKKESQPVWSHQDIHESIQHSWHSIDHGKRARHWTTWSTWGKQGG